MGNEPEKLFPPVRELPKIVSTSDGINFETLYCGNLFSVINLCGFDYPELMEELERITPILYRSRLRIELLPQKPRVRRVRKSGIWAVLLRGGLPAPALSDYPTPEGPFCKLCRILVLHRKEQRPHIEPLLRDFRHLVPIECALPESLTVDEARRAESAIRLTMKSETSTIENTPGISIRGRAGKYRPRFR